MKKILVILALLALVPAKGSAIELVFNGGFETGTLEGWDPTGSAIASQEWFEITPHTGSWMAVLSPWGLLDSGLAQDIDFTGHTSATVSFAYNLGAWDWSWLLDTGTDGLQVYLGDHLFFSQTINDPYGGGTTTTGWTVYSAAVPTEWLGESLRFVFWAENAVPGDPLQEMVVYIDDVSVTVPDLSSTLLLLAMGLSGLAGAARLRLRK